MSLDRIEQNTRSCVEHIIRNGMRHAPEGTAVKVTLESTDEGWSVAVRDHGPGIFEPSKVMVECRRQTVQTDTTPSRH